MLLVAMLLASCQHCFRSPSSLMSHTLKIVYILLAIKHLRLRLIYCTILKETSSFIGAENANKYP